MFKKFVNWWIQDEEKRRKIREQWKEEAKQEWKNIKQEVKEELEIERKPRKQSSASFLSSINKRSYNNDSSYKDALKTFLLAHLDVDTKFLIDKHISVGNNAFRTILNDNFFSDELRFEFLIDDTNNQIAIFTLNKSKGDQAVDVRGKVYPFEKIQDFKLDEHTEVTGESFVENNISGGSVNEVCHSMHIHILLNDLQEPKLSLQLIYPILFGTRKTDELYIQRTKEANELIAVLKYIKRKNEQNS